MFLLENQSRSSKLVSIEIDRNTEVQSITSTIDRCVTKFFKLVATNKLYPHILRNRLHITIIGKQSNFCRNRQKTSVLAVRALFLTFWKKKNEPWFFWWEIQNWSRFWIRTSTAKMPVYAHSAIHGQSSCSTNKQFLKKSFKPKARTRFTYVIRVIAKTRYSPTMIGSGSKIGKKYFVWPNEQAHFENFKKIKKYPVVFDEESNTGHGFEIWQRQQKCQLKPTLHCRGRMDTAKIYLKRVVGPWYWYPIRGSKYSFQVLKLATGLTVIPQMDMLDELLLLSSPAWTIIFVTYSVNYLTISNEPAHKKPFWFRRLPHMHLKIKLI